MEKVTVEEECVNGDHSAEKRAELAALLASQTLQSRPRLREFLQYVGDAALGGQAHQIKEHAIGVAVFSRQPDYSAHEDTIVRVTARQLRQKIDEYYQTEGRDSEWRITIPRGTYVPVFVKQDGPGEAPAEAGRRSRSDPIRWSGWIAAAVLAVLCIVLLVPRQSASPPSAPTILELMKPPSGQRINVVCGDAVVQVFKEITGFAPTVSDYQNGSYLIGADLVPSSRPGERIWEILRSRKLLATGNLQVLARLMEASAAANMTVRHPRDVTTRDFVEDNAILLSGPFANPWVQLFEGKLNFRIEQDDSSVVHIRNVSPEPGEMPFYHQVGSNGQRRAYARLAYLPNLSGKGRVLLIGGPSSVLMETMGTAVTDPAFLRDLAGRLGSASPLALPYFEVLMEVMEMAEAPVQTRIVAIRRVP